MAKADSPTRISRFAGQPTNRQRPVLAPPNAAGTASLLRLDLLNQFVIGQGEEIGEVEHHAACAFGGYIFSSFHNMPCSVANETTSAGNCSHTTGQ